MTRLINPGPGEMLDRLSILALKILYGRVAGKDVKAFELERGALFAKVAGSRTLTGQGFEAFVELSTVNSVLWHLEDDLRVLRAATDPTVPTQWREAALCAYRIQEFNDKRAELIMAINRQVGDQWEEKNEQLDPART